jgi:hypothetical protein
LEFVSGFLEFVSGAVSQARMIFDPACPSLVRESHVVRHRADSPAPLFYSFAMPRYHFNIRQGEKTNSPGLQEDFPDDRSAWREAAPLCPRL